MSIAYIFVSLEHAKSISSRFLLPPQHETEGVLFFTRNKRVVVLQVVSTSFWSVVAFAGIAIDYLVGASAEIGHILGVGGFGYYTAEPTCMAPLSCCSIMQQVMHRPLWLWRQKNMNFKWYAEICYSTKNKTYQLPLILVHVYTYDISPRVWAFHLLHCFLSQFRASDLVMSCACFLHKVSPQRQPFIVSYSAVCS